MFGLFSHRQRKPRRPAPRVARLCVERLEARDCPAGPTITSFSAAVQAGQKVVLSGTLTDANPAACMINFAQGSTTLGSVTADASGHFSYTSSSAKLGTVNATAFDSMAMQQSNTYSTNISTPAPTINLTVTLGSTQEKVTVSGTVTDVDAGGRTVTFTGTVSGSVTTASDGSFTFTTTASGLGKFTASTVDLWNQTGSNSSSVTSAAPTITLSYAVVSSTANTMTVTFSGTVTDDQSFANRVIYLGGISQLDGKTTMTDSNGNFSYEVVLPLGETGTVTAFTMDGFGLDSNTAAVSLV